jgi:hypothetical protein
LVGLRLVKDAGAFLFLRTVRFLLSLRLAVDTEVVLFLPARFTLFDLFLCLPLPV